MTNILWVAGRYQLGDDPGLFQDAHYVGHALELPFRKTWIDDSAQTVTLLIHTTDVETWGAWQGHSVLLNGTEVGRLKDASDTQGGTEIFQLPLARGTLDGILSGEDNFLLRVEIERQPSQPGLADDFVLTRIETDGTFAAKLGWK